MRNVPRYNLLLILPLAMLAACDDGNDSTVLVNAGDNGTSISVAGDSADGDAGFVAHQDGKSGKLSITAPGFQGSIALPKIKLGAGDFNMDGVGLYPGSTIDDISVQGGDNEGEVKVSFESPAAPDKVRNWFKDALTAKKYKVKDTAFGLEAVSPDDETTRIALSPMEGDKTDGTITMIGN